ncbi:DNA-deoxyinosine glycosylase [Cupriavidus metallidurans]|uniref:G:T/U mismatch-specific DNA glycosylase-like protein n=1 Tax=Cupriavidus metallidurans (strain ATCC 43123 / DSM 2839 / NBRC 102507 / CH34) TaxID=266264 RepID=Q1LKE4_CUPMC|nr:DNA-deoxyinosine glycosylase [Cupriavidus metallidurans]ABF09382.1 G:T/U mismatch-specific DNA glycosylase-like protein [Cupriavidus metallidurans CH34]QGS29754.1 DNA-deoxyinosine glycosylase [Cupriavidus metallidurans]
MTTKRCFPPVVDIHTRVLVLGSLPGEVSLAQSRYYAHKQNRFWHLMSDVLGVDLVGLEYEARLQALLDHRVGLWDVVAEARREGSLDSSIRDHQGNDLIGLIATLPTLKAIAFNGGTAAKIGEKTLADHGDRHAILRLPSSSPAYTLAYAEKRKAWESLRDWLD